MNGTLPEGFPSASSTGPKRSASSVNVILIVRRDFRGMRHKQLAKKKKQRDRGAEIRRP
jgi:hypothetical protein